MIALNDKNEAFHIEFQLRIASTDVVELELLEQIEEIDRIRTNTEVTKQVMPLADMGAMGNKYFYGVWFRMN
ncbi:hypothetical protein P4H06_31485 [Bacillus cereus]|uniref:hypothetical protein n=1 Tax=Bacillus cereus group TaxID=86661 RepID=UPI001298E450|nr:hypothetical protein [Bacillus thuringiensis]MEB8860784.1 hypothetical protein [Bacillus cereus]MEB9423223.1 hypothetical protein [Bacillus cereus]MEC2467113.1 hypothetical protein [Bacillus cereus]MRC87978.1 hypothetical protein [Bacillus thuringiensis]